MYTTTYKVISQGDISFYDGDPEVNGYKVIIKAPKELWNKFLSGEALINPVDIGYNPCGSETSLDNNDIFIDRKMVEEEYEWEEEYPGCFSNGSGDGYLYSKDQEDFTINVTEGPKNMSITIKG